MNFKYNKIALVLPVSLMALSAVAAVNVDDIPSVKAKNAEQLQTTKISNKHSKSRYFILLDDEPVALYQGNVKGLAATNIAASGGNNQTGTGKLNLNSSASIQYSNYLVNRQNETISKINSSLGRNIPIVKRFNVAINSLVADLSPSEVIALRKLPGVLAVEKEVMHQILSDVGPTHVGAPSIWDDANVSGSQGEGLIVAVLDTGIASYTQQAWGDFDFEFMEFHPSFADIGSDGYDHINPNGEGVYFGDCIDSPQWCNDKLIGVVSFEGLKADGVWDMRAGTGQDDHGHGTHVASTIAGNRVENVKYPTVFPSTENEWNHKYYESDLAVPISGVAPHANIISYKTCNAVGCSPSAAIEAIEHAIANNVDVINYSVGGSASSPWFTSDSLAFLSAREAGIHTAVAAGNAGNNGEKTVGSPGNSPWVTTVAALTHSRDFTPTKIATFTGGEIDLGELTGTGATSGIETPTDLVYAGDIEDVEIAENSGAIGVCAEGSLPRWWDEATIEGKIVVCRRGGFDSNGDPLTRLSKGKAALEARAAGMIFINSDEEIDNIANDLHMLPTVHLNYSDGEALIEWLKTGENHQVSFTGSELVLNSAKADITADFTSRGPDYYSNDYLVPDVGAPGASILAAGIGEYMHSEQLAPADKISGNFRFMSGTSMASPHIAGMYLLMKAAQPTWTPAEAQSALMMTAYTDIREDDNFDGELARADFHRTGSGSARINLAVNAGLVLNETRAGYEAANPYAEEMGISDSIDGWHGLPHKMNLPSLSKGECLMSCSWTRTFRATKAGSWNVSFEYSNDGFTLEADKQEFTVSEGEEVDITFTARASQGLGVKWANGRIVLKPTDKTMPVQTLPAAINFIAGETPESMAITATRTNDSVSLKGVTTIGSDELQITKSGLVKAEIHDFELMRDATNEIVFHYDNLEDKTIHAIPLNIQADAKRLVVEVLETTSPDIDIYIGVDSNLDGFPDAYEVANVPYQSATETAFEIIDEVNPLNETYWILVHNWAEGPAPLTEDQMVCEEGQEPDEGMTCADAPIIDVVKLAVTNVEVDSDNMKVTAPSSVEPLEQVNPKVQWQEDMNEGDIYHGVFWVGTSPELTQNVGAVRVNVNRGGDDVRVSDVSLDNDKMSFEISIAENMSGADRDYELSIDIVEGAVVDLVVQETDVQGANMQTEPMDVNYVLTDNMITWSYKHLSNSAMTTVSVVLDLSNIEGLVDATPVVESGVNTSDVTEVTSSAVIFYEGKPTFTISSNKSLVNEGDTITLTAELVDGVIESPELSYTWKQLSGTQVESLVTSGKTISFEAPEVSDLETLSFELIGSNGSKDASPVQISVEVDNKDSGGSTGIWLYILSLTALALRRRK